MLLESPTMDTLRDILECRGALVRSRAGNTRELLGVTVEYPLGMFPTRIVMARNFAAVEACAILGGTFCMEAIHRAAPKADLTLFGPLAQYGVLMKTQLPAFVSLLRKDPATRRAVMYLGRPTNALGDRAPCTNSVQGIIRGGQLTLIVSMRSWDIVFGLPYDVATWGYVGIVIARHLSVMPGKLVITAGSLHRYHQSASSAQSGTPLFRTCQMLMGPLSYDSWPTIREYAQSVIMGPETWLRS